MTAALRLHERLTRAGQAAAYLGASVPIALLGVLAVLLLVVGAALSVVGIGLPLLVVAAGACRRLVRLDRRVANRFLGGQIPPMTAARRAHTTGSPWRRSLAVLGDRGLWRTVGLLALKPLLTAALLIVGVAPLLVLVWLARLGIEALADLGGTDYFGPWSFGPGMGLALLAFALPVAVLALATLDALRTVACTVARALLLPRAVVGAPVRELLAESLGDHSVAIAYWLPDREIFVDETGRRVDLPQRASGRTWTTVERDGRPVAAIVHDAALDTTSELVHAAAAAASLAIDNERLKADLRARLEELRVSRLRIVEATDAARRRIERDLHDGAQQQLVALALELRLLHRRVADQPEITPLVDGLSERLSSALAELRELARGIHPSILTEQGLAPAIGALADRAPVEVRAVVGVEERLSEPVEAAAYFVVAEALTNVVKYARASAVEVEVRCADGDVLVEVADDGVGGVDVTAGSGLRGLEDRLAAVDGRLVIDSPPEGGTRLRARIPVVAENGEMEEGA
ncbi:MAG TPA: sensor domain-containing protein [Baekduia sp.]|nr:sensor domain-containing protein [Baekduia sp.]